MNTGIMLDLETMGNGNNAAIVAIGAIKFDSKELTIENKFYTNVDISSCEAAGLTITGSTVMWWMQQSEEARKALNNSPLPLTEALQRFSSWCGDVPVYGNASTFDNVILRNSYNKLNIKCPWHYRNDRCYRTLKNLYPNAPVPPDNTDKHNALSDAHWQTLHLFEIFKQMRTK